MRRRLLRALALAPVLMGLIACQSIKNMMPGVDSSNAVAPNELETIENRLKVATLWKEQIGKGADKQYVKLTPVVIGEHLFAADRHGRLACIDLTKGKEVWEIKDKDVAYTGGPGGGDGLVLMGTGDARVIAREAETGKVRWVAKVSSEVLAPPRASGGVTVVRTGDGRMFGLDSASGRELWAYERSVPNLTLRGVGAPVIEDDIALAGFDNGRFAAVNARSGKMMWESPLAVPSGRSDLERMVDIDAEPVIAGTTVFAASFNGGVTALSIADGKILWTREVSSYQEISVGDEHVYVTDDKGVVWALDRKTGNSVWKQEALENRFVTAPTYFQGHVVVSDFEGYVHWLDAASGEFEYREKIAKERILAPAIDAGGLLLVSTATGEVVAMHPQ